jgi:hypothetical protein
VRSILVLEEGLAGHDVGPLDHRKLGDTIALDVVHQIDDEVVVVLDLLDQPRVDVGITVDRLILVPNGLLEVLEVIVVVLPFLNC